MPTTQLYSPEPFARYVARFPACSEISALLTAPIKLQTAAWNAYWLLRPELEYVLKGEPWHWKCGVIPGLMPAIIQDMVSYRDRFVDHPLNLADFLAFNNPSLACQAPAYRDNLPSLWSRAISVANRLLEDDPLLVCVGETVVLRYP